MFIFSKTRKYEVLLTVIGIFGVGLIATGLNLTLRKSTENQVASKALMLIETMNSVRDYTSTQVKPELIERTNSEFLPQTIPAYSAREVFEGLRLKNVDFSEFRYKEATLNPSNLRDKANPFEKKLVEKFIAKEGIKEQRGFYDDVAGQKFYIARPIKITKSSCLQCHSTPDVAPKSVIDRYGSINGMGWKLNEIIGAQIISVPAETVIKQANQSFLTLMTIVLSVFALILLSIFFVLDRHVFKPLRKTARVAEEVGVGQMDSEFRPTSNREINKIIRAFERLKAALKSTGAEIKN